MGMEIEIEMSTREATGIILTELDVNTGICCSGSKSGWHLKRLVMTTEMLMVMAIALITERLR